MMNRPRALIFLGTLGVFVGFVIGVWLRATLTKQGAAIVVAASPIDSAQVIDIGNPTCPIMGGTTKEEFYTTWRGLRVRFCCTGCEEEFLANPEELLREMGVDVEQALRDVESQQLQASGGPATGF